MTKLAMDFTSTGATVLWISGTEPNVLASAVAPKQTNKPQTKTATKNTGIANHV